MSSSQIRMIEDAHYARFYARKPIAIVRGRDVFVYDAEGKEYIDCAGAYGTCIIGHTHPKVAEAIANQASRLIACHGSTYNDARADFLSKLLSVMPKELDQIYLSNSGAEAVECAIKIARKSTGRKDIIAMKSGYHGKTHGALSATWESKYKKSFEPLLPNFKHVQFGNEEAAKTAISKDTAAVLIEPIQGEGGIRVPPPQWLPALRQLTEDAGALLIDDEIQTGFGRTGKMFACAHYGIIPDILCSGKGVASGLPIGITVSNDKVMNSLTVGEHTSTFGGNPIVCAAGSATIDVILNERLVENAASVGNYLAKRLENIKQGLRIVREIRGMGLMLGAELRFDVFPILQNTLEHGVLVLDAGRNVLRFLPPISIQQHHIDKVLVVLQEAMEKEELAKLPH